MRGRSVRKTIVRDTTVRAMLASGGTGLHCAVGWSGCGWTCGGLVARRGPRGRVHCCCCMSRHCCCAALLQGTMAMLRRCRLLSGGRSNAAAHVSTLLPAAHLVVLSEDLLQCSEPLLQLLLLWQAGAISTAAVAGAISTAAVDLNAHQRRCCCRRNLHCCCCRSN